MASAKETRHRLKGATDTARWGYGVRGPDGGVQARRPPLWGTRRGSMGFSESQHSSSKTRHTAEDGGGDEMQLHEPMSPLRRRAQPGPGWGGASMRHNTHVHQADHNLRTSPCYPNSRLFSVRAGQQSSPYVLSILTRKGDRVGEPGSPGAVVPAVNTGASSHIGRPPAGAGETWGQRLPSPSPPPRRRSPRC